MKKIGKDEIFAIIESGLFLIGAVFLSIVFIDENNPLWALWVGLGFAGVGVLLWLRPLLFRSKKHGKEKEEEIPLVYEPYRPAPQTAQAETKNADESSSNKDDGNLDLDW